MMLDTLYRLPLHTLLEIKALTASRDGACVAAVIPDPTCAFAPFISFKTKCSTDLFSAIVASDPLLCRC